MFVYFGKQIMHAIVGTRVTPVTCERCACAYRYRTVRRGEGTATAPYCIDLKGAERRARRRAEKQAKKRIASAIDPVPCPTCGWIQSTMVDELRRRAYRWMPWTGGAVGLALLALTPLVNHVIGSYGAQNMQTVYTIAAIIVAIGMVPAAMFARRTLLKRIDPNHSFPAAPAPIAGAPRGYLVGPDDAPIASDAAFTVESPGRNTLGYERIDPQLTAGGWYVAQMLDLRFPSMCARCATPTSRTITFKHVAGLRAALPFNIAVPMCATCVRAAKRRRAIIYGVGIGFVVVASLAAGFLSSGRPGREFERAIGTAIPLGLLAAIPLYLARQVKPPVKFGGFSAERNTIRIKFKNEKFMQAFVAESLQPQPTVVAPAQGMADAARQLTAATGRARGKRRSPGLPTVDA